MIYKVTIGTRTGVRSDQVMFSKEFSITAASCNSAKIQASVLAKLEPKIIKTGWREWTSEGCIAVRDTLCDRSGRQSFIHLFWEGEHAENNR